MKRKNNKSYFVNYNALVQIFSPYGAIIKLTPVIMTGTLKEILDFNPKFESIIHTLYGLEK